MTERTTLENLGPLRVSAILKHYCTIRKASKAVGVSHTALLRYMREKSMVLPKPTPEALDWLKSQRAPSSRSAALPKWVAANPGVKLPPSVKGMQRVTGLSQWQIQSYLTRERGKRVRQLEGLKKSELKMLFKLPNGRKVRLRDCAKSNFAVGRWTLRVSVHLIARDFIALKSVALGSEESFTFKIEDYGALIENR